MPTHSELLIKYLGFEPTSRLAVVASRLCIRYYSSQHSREARKRHTACPACTLLPETETLLEGDEPTSRPYRVSRVKEKESTKSIEMIGVMREIAVGGCLACSTMLSSGVTSAFLN